MVNHCENKGLDKLAVKTMASLARGIARDSVKATSWILVHQPEEPKDLAKRLQTMKK